MKQHTRIPTDLAWWNPIALVATCFGIGRISYFATTLASLLAYVIVIAIRDRPDFYFVLACITGSLFLIGWFASYFYIRETQIAHPHDVVIDELVGQLSGILFFFYSSSLILKYWTPAYRDSFFLSDYFIPNATLFVLFRFYDATKPHWLKWLDRNVKGGFGIMLDDVAAGVYATLTLHSFIIWELLLDHLTTVRGG